MMYTIRYGETHGETTEIDVLAETPEEAIEKVFGEDIAILMGGDSISEFLHDNIIDMRL